MISSIVYGKPRSQIDNNSYHNAITTDDVMTYVYACLVPLLLWVLMYSFLCNIQRFTIITIIKKLLFLSQ